MRFSNRLIIRIMIPFLTLLLLVNAITLVLNRRSISRILDQRMTRQTDRLSQVLSNSELVFNSNYLRKLKDVIEDDLIVIEGGSNVVLTTMPPDLTDLILSRVGKGDLFNFLKENESVIRKMNIDGCGSFLIALRNLALPEKTYSNPVLCVMTPLGDIDKEKSMISNRLLLINGIGLLLALVFGWTIARSIARPVSELVAVTGKIAEGNFDQKAGHAGIDELEKLAVSVNAMSEKLKQYEHQIIQSSRQAAAARITAAMAHEIGNPLSGIKMLTQLLRDHPDQTADSRKLVQSLLEEVVRIEKIVNDTMQMIRPPGIKCIPFQLNRLVHELLPLLNAKMAHLKIMLHQELEPDLPDIRLDPDRIKQVVWNLMLNAMDSMPTGGTLVISTGRNSEGKSFFISVADEGSGISKEVMTQIFDPFYTTKEEGLGLGLAISKEIVEAHGGLLKIENRKTGGVRAVIEFPTLPNSDETKSFTVFGLGQPFEKQNIESEINSKGATNQDSYPELRMKDCTEIKKWRIY